MLCYVMLYCIILDYIIVHCFILYDIVVNYIVILSYLVLHALKPPKVQSKRLRPRPPLSGWCGS